MTLDLVLDIGNSSVKTGFFEENSLKECASLPHDGIQNSLKDKLKGLSFQCAMISSVNAQIEQTVKQLLEEEKIPYHLLHYKDLKVILEVDEPEALGPDRIANIYGALFHYPYNDCIVVDIGTAVTFDYITKDGHYVGGSIYPGSDLCAKALANFTDKLPYVKIAKPLSPLAKTTETHIQSGIYYGLLGAIERMVAELQMTAQSPSSVHVIATGGATFSDATGGNEFLEDLKELVDVIDPHLTLVGLHEILKEKRRK
ncbi:MAG TPA: type III pantothenate kinase [Rhabdochlamydiaceae bacterium]|nr:type III pantothenate kinase [Rhabdochlamydiaceae bacterium]